MRDPQSLMGSLPPAVAGRRAAASLVSFAQPCASKVLENVWAVGGLKPPPRAKLGDLFMCSSEREYLSDADLQRQIAVHVEACRQRIPAFVATHYSGRGAIGLNRRAFGTDVLVAPVNFLMGFPNFVLRIVAGLLDVFGARKAAKWLARSHLGLPTAVQKTLAARLMTELLDLPQDPEETSDPVRRLLSAAAREPVGIYVQTRNVAADITAGTLAALLGLVFLHQFTPGSISAGSAVAKVVAREQAVSQFVLGETLGRLYYTLFPVSPSLTLIVLALLPIMAAIAAVAAFAGMIHDPVQSAAGIHRRRLSRMVDAIEELASECGGKGYRPKDTFFGRVYDLMDWIKGVLSF
jgi:hypothetical protein